MTDLILNQRGTSISVKNGKYLVRNKDLEESIPTHLVRSIVLCPATTLTYDVVAVALQHQTEIIFQDRRAFPVARVWSNKFGSISTIRKNQLIFSKSVEGAQWIKEVILMKAENQIIMIQFLAELNHTHLDLSLIHRTVLKVRALNKTDMADFFSSLRGLEGTISREYFKHISALIPPKYRFSKRSQNPALDAFNGLLNYAYGMLYSICESALIKAGIDPYIGLMHRDEYNKPVFVYDFIEMFRHWADYVVIHLCVQEVVEDDFFSVTNGEYWLEDFGKKILIQTFNDYFQEVVFFQELHRTRRVHIELVAQKLANHLKKIA